MAVNCDFVFFGEQPLYIFKSFKYIFSGFKKKNDDKHYSFTTVFLRVYNNVNKFLSGCLLFLVYFFCFTILHYTSGELTSHFWACFTSLCLSVFLNTYFIIAWFLWPNHNIVLKGPPLWIQRAEHQALLVKAINSEHCEVYHLNEAACFGSVQDVLRLQNNRWWEWGLEYKHCRHIRV